MKILEYNRQRAVNYAHKWAYSRNKKYLDFAPFGGDCTNFVSQCIFAGSGVMNYKIDTGWYYINSKNRAAAWTGSHYLYKFLMENKGMGPFGTAAGAKDVKEGDLAFILFEDREAVSHTTIIVEAETPKNTSNILVAAHDFDADYRPLSSYEYKEILYIHIEGARE